MDTAYLSHVPLLSSAITVTSGPVLELGAGFGSTPLLHGLCGSFKRELLTLESDGEWLQKFINFGRSWHHFRSVENFIDLPEYKQDWGLVFVDHGIAEQRGLSIRSLRHVPVIVVHDTCHPFLYDYEPTLSTFKFLWDWKLVGPMTTVVSDSVDVRQIFAGFCL